MGEETSLLMDGELELSRLDPICCALKAAQAKHEWDCYHLIGDCLRNPETARLPRSFANGEFLAQVASSLQDEPTVLAPRSSKVQPAFVAWAVAASVAAMSFVGWFALQEFAPGESAGAARVAGEVRPVQAQRTSNVADYVAVHRQYAPATGMESLRPYIRNVAIPQDPSQ